MDSIIGNELRKRLKDLSALENKENTYCCRIFFDRAFRGFEGHFEGNPVVPGVCLIELIRVHAEEILQKELIVKEIGQCKFRSPLLAGMEGECITQIREADGSIFSVQAEIRNDSGSACKMKLVLTERTAAR